MFTPLCKPAFPRLACSAVTKAKYINTHLSPSVFQINKFNTAFTSSSYNTLRSSHYTPTTKRHFTTTSSKMGADAFLEAIANRRSVYGLSKSSPISDKRIQEILASIIKNVPSSFNAQSTRVVFLAGAEHEKLWDLHKDVLKPIVPAEGWAATDGKIDMFKAAYGTVLFFNDNDVVKGQENAFAMYAPRFGPWAAESNAMHQFAAWTALEAEGLGASLQHYNPLIDAKVVEHWNVPKTWTLQAELVIGTPTGENGPKEFAPIEGTRLFSYGTSS